ncbi:MAG: DUF294 nucleotidyltransferase-like domain-containing protein, partial [Cryomorphaceae bacterium]|nr:DUF294 nucleotidyltransferase-like domain-containing protein [Cryomorphaceae bacterium]
ISSQAALIDMCDEGDVFGVRALIANDAYLADAETEEDSILYKIPLDAFKRILIENPAVSHYFTSGFASGKSLPKTPFRMPTSSAVSTQFMSGVQVVESRREVLCCSENDCIKDAAILMKKRGVGSIVIVDKESLPVGIITDKDLRNKVATGVVNINESVAEIMSNPVACVAPDKTQTDYLIIMLTKRIHHLCVTEDGTPHTPVIGMITEHDLLLLQGTNPAVILREMDKADSFSQLGTLRQNAAGLFKQHLKQELPVGVTCRLATAINDRLLQKVIALTIEKLGPPPCSFNWLALGSLGRGEQILQTDQDHALVFSEEGHQAYFLQLAKVVSDHLEQLGFPRDPADVSAENPKWCMSLKKWKKQFSQWMHTPDNQAILHCNIFFDFRGVFGDYALDEELRNHINHEQSGVELFTALLAKEAVETPAPLSFFRNLVVERSGANKDQFDLKLRVLLPLVDCARVLAITHAISASTTTARYEALKLKLPERASLFNSAIEATQYAIRLKAISGFRNNDNGRYIAPDMLSKLERQMLRSVFETIDELQQMLKLTFQTDRLR